MFNDVSLFWKGKEYKVPPNKMMGLIGGIEEYFTHEKLIYIITSISIASEKSKIDNLEALKHLDIPRVKMAQAYGYALRYAGANATDEEVWSSLFGEDGVTVVVVALEALMRITSPPEEFKEKKPQAAAKPKPRAKKKTTASSSKPRTR